MLILTFLVKISVEAQYKADYNFFKKKVTKKPKKYMSKPEYPLKTQKRIPFTPRISFLKTTVACSATSLRDYIKIVSNLRHLS